MGPLDRQLSPTHLLLAGLLLVPAFLLQADLAVKAAQTGVFILLCAVTGRRFNLIVSAVLFAGITAVSLLTPAGRVLLRLGPLTVTELALRQGLFRAITVTGLYYLSRFTIRRDIALPGMAGRLMSRVFTYYELLMRSASLRPDRFMETLDDGLLAASGSKGTVGPPDTSTKSEAARSTGTTPMGCALIMTLVFLSWGLLLL